MKNFKTRKMVLAAFFIALSIVLTHVLTISTPIVRINLGGLPILLSGALFGPVIGFTVGAIADLIGGTLAGYSINPLITLGTACVGGFMGLCVRFIPLKKISMRLLLGVIIGNLVGSVIINSLALHIFYGWTLQVLWVRIPENVFIGIAEYFLLFFLFKNKEIQKVFMQNEKQKIKGELNI